MTEGREAGNRKGRREEGRNGINKWKFVLQLYKGLYDKFPCQENRNQGLNIRGSLVAEVVETGPFIQIKVSQTNQFSYEGQEVHRNHFLIAEMGETSLRNFSLVFYLKQKATEEFRILSQNKTIIKMIIICIIYGAKYCIEDGAN